MNAKFAEVIALTLCLCGLVFGDCGVVDHKGWGGLDPVNVEYLPRPLDLVIIQHSVTPSCSTDAGCEELVRGMQDYHMNNQNYWDLGSSFYLGGNGKVYGGPGWLHKGAHTYGYNGRSIGLSFIGNFDETRPSTKMLDAARALLKCGVAEGHLTANYRVVGHRQLIPTISPGRYLYSEIRKWPEYVEDVSEIKNGH